MSGPVEQAALRVAELIHSEAAEIGDPSYEFTIWRAAKAYIAKSHSGPQRNDEGPGRWAARILLFDSHDVLVADSEPDRDLDELPRESLATLRAVGAWVRETATAWHESMRMTAPEGLDDGTIDRRILTARVTLSRHKGGLVWWKLPYEVAGEQWHAHVRLAKLTEEQAEAATRPKPQFRQVPQPET